MTVSQNGWSVDPPLDNRAVPGTSVKLAPGVRAGDVATVLLWVAQQWHQRVEPLEAGTCWGYANRSVRGSTSVSNHASATAMDLNAPRHPLGSAPAATLSAKQIAEVRKIVAETDGVVRWGGDYTGRKDVMHFEINASPSAVSAVARKLSSPQTPAPTPAAGSNIVVLETQ